MIEVGKYNRESTNTDFNSDLGVEGLVLEILSLNTLLMMMMMMIMIMMIMMIKMIIAVTQSILKLGPPDFSWNKI